MSKFKILKERQEGVEISEKNHGKDCEGYEGTIKKPRQEKTLDRHGIP